MLQVNLAHVVRGTSWYHSLKAGTRVNSSSGFFASAIRGHITSKLNELKTALDASRGRWSA